MVYFLCDQIVKVTRHMKLQQGFENVKMQAGFHHNHVCISKKPNTPAIFENKGKQIDTNLLQAGHVQQNLTNLLSTRAWLLQPPAQQTH